jgi:hypothetical protein
MVVFKINIAMDDRKVHHALYQASLPEETDTKLKTQDDVAVPLQTPEAMSISIQYNSED